MKSVFSNILIKNTLAIFGAVTLIILLVVGVYIGYSLTSGTKTEIDKATKSDVRFVLNWCELGDEKIETVLRSYVSGMSFSGDHHDAYLIKIRNLNMAELQMTNSGRWYRGDQLPKILDDAVQFAGGFQYYTPWFPTESQIKKADIFVYPWSIYCNGIRPTSVQLIILDPKKNLVYYISASI